MTCATYTVEGIDLDRWDLLLGTTYRLPVAAVLQSVGIPGRHGHLPVGLPTFSAPPMVCQLAPTRPDGSLAEFERMNDALAALAGHPYPTMTRRVGEAVTQAKVRLLNVSWDPSAIEHGHTARATLTYEVPGVFWRDPAPTDVAVAAGTHSVTALAGTAPVSDAVVRFDPGASSSRSLHDTTSDTGIQIDTAGVSGYAYVDLSTLAAWSSASAAAWNIPGSGRLDAAVSYPAAGPLQLWPKVTEAGGNLVRSVELLAHNPATIRGRRAWW